MTLIALVNISFSVAGAILNVLYFHRCKKSPYRWTKLSIALVCLYFAYLFIAGIFDNNADLTKQTQLGTTALLGSIVAATIANPPEARHERC